MDPPSGSYQNRLDRAKSLITPESAQEKGVELIYLNTSGDDSTEQLRELTGNKGFDDVFVFSAVTQLLEQADDILGMDGCLNFFAGPTDNRFKVPFNYYNVHYTSTHIVGTSGGSTDDMKDSLKLSAENQINPSYMITHIGGLESVPETVINLKNVNSGKILIYPHIDFPLTPLVDICDGKVTGKLSEGLKVILNENNGIWSKDAEVYLLNYYAV